MSAQRVQQLAVQGEGVSVLVRSVEKVFRNLVRMLVGKLTLTRIQSILREVFIEEAEKKLKRERQGRNVPLSQLALISGLDTRTVIKIRGEIDARQANGSSKVEMSELSPEARVVEMWLLRDEGEGPPELDFGSPGSAFDVLVKEVVTSRGVTTQSILQRLLATGTVKENSETGRLSLVTDRYSPFNSDDEVALMTTGLQAIMNLTGTIDHNVRSPQEDRLIQREVWTFRLDPERRDEFRNVLRGYLIRTQKQATDLLEPIESEFQSEGQVTAGFGMYYYEEDPG